MANLLRGTAYHAARCALPDHGQKTPSQAMCTAPGPSSSIERCLCLPLCSSRFCMSCVGCGRNAGPTATASSECQGRPERRMLGCTAIRITGDQPSIAHHEDNLAERAQGFLTRRWQAALQPQRTMYRAGGDPTCLRICVYGRALLTRTCCAAGASPTSPRSRQYHNSSLLSHLPFMLLRACPMNMTTPALWPLHLLTDLGADLEGISYLEARWRILKSKRQASRDGQPRGHAGPSRGGAEAGAPAAEARQAPAAASCRDGPLSERT